MTRTVLRAMTVLTSFHGVNHPVTLQEISDRVGLDPATTSRLLKDLVAFDLVYHDGHARSYTLGYKVLELASNLWQGKSLVELVRPALTHLRDLTSQTCEFNLRRGMRQTVIEEVLSKSPVKYSNGIGSAAPLYAAAGGRVILAFAAPDVIEAVLSQPLERLTPNTIVDPIRLREVLAAVKHLGFAHSEGERDLGATALAVPVIDQSGYAMGSVGTLWPRPKLDFSAAEFDQHVAWLKECAARISLVVRNARVGMPDDTGSAVPAPLSPSPATAGREG